MRRIKQESLLLCLEPSQVRIQSLSEVGVGRGIGYLCTVFNGEIGRSGRVVGSSCWVATRYFSVCMLVMS